MQRPIWMIYVTTMLLRLHNLIFDRYTDEQSREARRRSDEIWENWNC
jgi:hypothetical protein